MKFILKDKHIFVVENDDLVYNNIEGDVIIGDTFTSPEAKIQFSVNGGLFKEVKNNKISIDKEEIKEPYFELTVRILNNDSVEVFTTDKIPLTHALILGHPIENKYPEIIRSLIESTRRLDAQQKDIQAQQQDIIKVLNYLDTKGEVL
jgi:hypothetical protein